MNMEIRKTVSADVVQSPAITPANQQHPVQKPAVSVTAVLEDGAFQKKAASLSLSEEGQALAHRLNRSRKSVQTGSAVTKEEARSALDQVKKQLSEAPDLVRRVHSNLDVMRIVHKIY